MDERDLAVQREMLVVVSSTKIERECVAIYIRRKAEDLRKEGNGVKPNTEWYHRLRNLADEIERGEHNPTQEEAEVSDERSSS